MIININGIPELSTQQQYVLVLTSERQSLIAGRRSLAMPKKQSFAVSDEWPPYARLHSSVHPLYSLAIPVLLCYAIVAFLICKERGGRMPPARETPRSVMLSEWTDMSFPSDTVWGVSPASLETSQREESLIGSTGPRGPS